MRVTNWFLIGFKDPTYEETHDWYHKSGQEIMIGLFIGCVDEHTTIILLTGHIIKLPSKFVSSIPLVW